MAYKSPGLFGTTNQISVTDSLGSYDVALSSSLVRSSQPCFFASITGNQTNATGDGTNFNIVCGTEVFDSGNNFNPATGQFTAPVTGRYFFIACVTLSNLLSAHTASQFRLINASVMRGNATNPGTTFATVSGQLCYNYSLICSVASGVTVIPQIVVSNSTKTVTVVQGTNATYFCGYLMN